MNRTQQSVRTGDIMHVQISSGGDIFLRRNEMRIGLIGLALAAGVAAFATQASAAPIVPLGQDDGEIVLVAGDAGLDGTGRPGAAVRIGLAHGGARGASGRAARGPAASRVSLVIAAQSTPAAVFHSAGVLSY
jgi:hypothetical protein